MLNFIVYGITVFLMFILVLGGFMLTQINFISVNNYFFALFLIIDIFALSFAFFYFISKVKELKEVSFTLLFFILLYYFEALPFTI